MGGTIFVFIGTQIKNYSNSAEKFIREFVGDFPDSEGMVLFRLEDDECEKVWTIRNGVISESKFNFGFRP